MGLDGGLQSSIPTRQSLMVPVEENPLLKGTNAEGKDEELAISIEIP